MADPSLTARIGPRRAELFREILGAWLNTTADDREPIEARLMDGGLRLLHPGFSGRNVMARSEDIDALVAEDLLRQVIDSMDGSRSLEPSRGRLDTLEASQQLPTPQGHIGFKTSGDA